MLFALKVTNITFPETRHQKYSCQIIGKEVVHKLTLWLERDLINLYGTQSSNSSKFLKFSAIETFVGQPGLGGFEH